MSLYLDTWEDGTEILSKVMGPKYWKIKLHQKIQKALAQRDKFFLSQLIRASGLLRNVSDESYFTSKSMMMLVAGLCTAYPSDEKIKHLSQQFFRRIQRRQRNKIYREILKRNAMGEETGETMPEEADGIILCKTPGQYALVLSAAPDPVRDLSLLLANPLADVDFIEITKQMPRDQWHIFIDRIDVLKDDVISWTAFLIFLKTCNEEEIQQIHQYCSSYWRKYHQIINPIKIKTENEEETGIKDEDVAQIKQEVFTILSL